MSIRDIIWPDVKDQKQAKSAAYYGLYACVVIIAISLFNLQWLEGIFAAIGIGIYKLSRIAAVTGPVLYVTEKIFILVQGGSLFSVGIAIGVAIADRKLVRTSLDCPFDERGAV